MADAERQVREDSDQLMSELEKLKALELQKRGERFSSPPFHALADQVERQARAVFDLAAAEQEDGERTAPSGRSINDVDNGGGKPTGGRAELEPGGWQGQIAERE